MPSTEAIIIALIVAVVAVLAVRARKSPGGLVGEVESELGLRERWGQPSAGSSGSQDFYSQLGVERTAENARIDARVGVRNDGAGWGAQRPVHPMDRPVQSRNGVFMDPTRLAAAEQQAWAPYSSTSGPPAFDMKKGSYSGSDLTQQLGGVDEGDWSAQIADLAIDKRTKEQHRQWVDEVGPFSQGAFSVDNLDEAVAMSQHRVGMRAFQALTPAQSKCTLQVTELDADAHAAQFKPATF
jgi:hypothetical protein